MNQQINLYQPIFRKQPKVFSAATIAQIAGIVLLVLILIYIYGRWQVALLGREATRLTRQMQADTGRLGQLEATLPARTPDPALQARLKALLAERASKERALAALGERSYGSTRGFSAQFVGLARQHVAGLWLTQVKLSQGGSRFSLAGETVDPRLVPDYLQRLAAVPVFKGTQFGLLRIERPKGQSRALAFRASTAVEDKSAREAEHAPAP